MPAPPAPDVPAWPVGVVAARLKTTTATLRAWERRYGLAPSARTRGGHRRYTVEDVALLLRMRDLLAHGVAPADAARALSVGAGPGQPAAGRQAHALPGPRRHSEITGRQRVDALTAAMHALDADLVESLVADTLAEAGAVAAWTNLLAPALTAIGDHWQGTGCGVEIEHLASGVVEAVLRRHARAGIDAESGTSARPVPASAASAPLMLAAVPGETHTLPLTALAAALAESGMPTRLFGELPTPALIAAVQRLRPRAVVLWAFLPQSAASAAVRDMAAATTAPLHPAGPGWRTRHLPGGVPAALLSLPEAVELLRTRYTTARASL